MLREVANIWPCVLIMPDKPPPTADAVLIIETIPAIKVVEAKRAVIKPLRKVAEPSNKATMSAKKVAEPFR